VIRRPLAAARRLLAGYSHQAVLAALAGAVCGINTGCKQDMADQPYYKPYEPTAFFEDGRSNRPLEPNVVHRGQYLDHDPLATGLTAEEWGRLWRRGEKKADPAAATPDEDRETAYAAPRYDPRPGQPHSGPAVYVTEFPFAMTDRDVALGARRFTAYCAMCHGPLGNGKGKIWERGYLKPTSFHTEPVEANEPPDYGQIPLGFSRGYFKWDIRIPLRDVPVGYYFEVITRGYGAMSSYAAQIKPDDRWRIVAYVRALQLSQRADVTGLPPDVVQRLNAGGNQP
jgi:mono/diheme cytochrome c family protein